jgi:nucleoside-diphosphate-sugar epimerase
MHRALVIGSEGNIGKPLVAHLKATGYDVLEVDIRPGWRSNYLLADINHPLDLLEAFDWGPSRVFMLSAMVSRVTCEQAAGLAVATNLEGLNNVVQLSKRVGARLIYFSTSEIYGPAVDPMDEETPDPAPNNRYGLTKLLGEKLVEYEVRQHRLSAISLRPFMIYDEHEDFGDHRSAMIRFAHNLARGREIEVHRGSARGWLHVSDAIAAIERSAELSEYAVVNIGHRDVVPIEDLAERIRGELDADPALLRHVDQPSQMTLVKRPKLDRMRDLLGVEPKIGLEEGIRRVCATTSARLERTRDDRLRSARLA